MGRDARDFGEAREALLKSAPEHLMNMSNLSRRGILTVHTRIPPEGSPGADFNRRATKAQVLSMLERHGWVADHSQQGTDFLRRPGKTQGWSASLGHVAPNVLFVFSSNAAPFQGPRGDKLGTAYKPFGVYGLLESRWRFQGRRPHLSSRWLRRITRETSSYTSSNGSDSAGRTSSIIKTCNGEEPPAPPNNGPETIIEMPRQPLPLSDQTNAETLVRWYGRDIRYCNEFKQWLFWDGRRWAYDTTQHVMRLAKATIKRLAATAEDLG